MRFFSKFVVVCNICFLIAFVMRFIERRPSNVSHDAVIPLPFVEGTIAILGMVVAIAVNAAFVFIVLFRKSIRRPVIVSPFIIWFNIIMLAMEIWAQFFYRG